MSKKKSKKVIIISTPLSPMVLILFPFMIFIIIELIRMRTNNVSTLSPTEKRFDPLLPLPPPRLGLVHHSHDHEPKSFRKIGFLQSRELADSIMLPLFGDRAPYRRNRWNYYTITDTHQNLSSVNLPVIYKDRSCVDEVACDELYTNDVVKVHGYDSPFVVHIY
tara:strand:+ start:1056 stop:1547 length:492 start_codon:yes stop_codon:yes gene_type:complete